MDSKKAKLNPALLKDLLRDVTIQRNQMMVLVNNYLERWFNHPSLEGVIDAIKALDAEVIKLKREVELSEANKNESTINGVANSKRGFYRASVARFNKLLSNGLGSLFNNRTLK